MSRAEEHHVVASSFGDLAFSQAEFRRAYLQRFPDRTAHSIMAHEFCYQEADGRPRDVASMTAGPKFIVKLGPNSYRYSPQP
jgi:hypothetical protein